MNNSIEKSEPKAGCSKVLTTVDHHLDTDEDYDCEVNQLTVDHPDIDRREEENPFANENYQIVSDLSSLQSYTIADDVIIEHIEVQEGECAEAMRSDKSDCQTEDEHQPKTTKKKKVPSPVENWDDSEKLNFLNGIKTYGIDDIDNVATMIPSKTIEEVKAASDHYRLEAEQRILYTARNLTTPFRRLKKQRPIIGNPLAEWMCLLNENLNIEELNTVSADAVRMIASCEKFPPPTECTDINFRQVYHTLANAIEGRPLPEISPESQDILRRALIEVSLSLKNPRGVAFENFVKSITSLRSQLVPKGEKFKCPLKTLLANLASVKKYNPLNVTIDYLHRPTSSSFTVKDNIFS